MRATSDIVFFCTRILLALTLAALFKMPARAAEIRVVPGPDALAKAQSEARKAIAAGEAVTVTLSDGVYRMERPLEFGPRDSGTAQRPVIWKAEHRGRAVVTGGAELREVPIDWAQTPASLIPEASRSHVRCWEIGGTWEIPGFYNGGCCNRPELYDEAVCVFSGGKRATIARWPNGRFARTGDPQGENVETSGSFSDRHRQNNTGVFKLRDAPFAAWTKEPDLWAYGMYGKEWSNISSPVLKADPGKGTLAVEPSKNPYGFLPGMPFYVFNSFSDLDCEGEWAIDRKCRRIYLWGRDAGAPIVSGATFFIRGSNVNHVEFDGLVFEAVRGTALRFANADAVVFRSSCIRRIGGGCIVFRKSRNCRVEGCDLYDVGEKGVMMEGGDWTTLTPGSNVVDNCHIHHFGCVSPNYNPAVQLTGCGNRATHNLIHHSPHSAIQFGGNDHYIGYNVCHDCCTFTDDAGTIYCCQRDWTKRGTVIEYNAIHMTGKQPRARHVRGIYLDDWSSGTVVRGNIVNRAPQCVYLGGGHDNLIVGNVLVNGPESGADIGTRGLDSFAKNETAKGDKSYIYQRYLKTRKIWDTPLWRARYPRLAELEKLPTPIDAHNANFNVITGNVLAATAGVTHMNWKAIAERTVITNNCETAGDPGFVDYYGFDWELKDDSPARQILGGGTHFGEMGLYESTQRFSPAVKHGEEITRPRPFGVDKLSPQLRLYITIAGRKGAIVSTGFGVGADWDTNEISFVPDRTGEARYRILPRSEKCEEVAFADVLINGRAADGMCRAGGITQPVTNGVPVTVSFRSRLAIPDVN